MFVHMTKLMSRLTSFIVYAGKFCDDSIEFRTSFWEGVRSFMIIVGEWVSSAQGPVDSRVGLWKKSCLEEEKKEEEKDEKEEKEKGKPLILTNVRVGCRRVVTLSGFT